MTDRTTESTVRQTLDVPMQSIDEVQDHVDALRRLIGWTEIGILFDDQPAGVLAVQLDGDKVVGVCRFCLSPEESAIALEAYGVDDAGIDLRSYQGHTLKRDEIINLESLTDIWDKAQTSKVSLQQAKDFFQRIESEARERGREGNIRTDTRNQILFDAHGRCMFEGCGKDLALDPTTGRKGNFAYLAHNVAASETGPRGVLYLSGMLADDASNILLLCDVHHRLVDTVARADYPADRLSEMRSKFCEDADKLLDRLSKPKIPAFCISWPVHRQVISAPSVAQITESLVPIGARLDGQLRRLHDNDRTLRDADPDTVWSLMPEAIEVAAAEILAQSSTESYRAALFAMGLMPALIALGAKLGNKSAITPMLFHRESGLWYWPSQEQQGEFFTISGLEQLPPKSEEIVIEVALTARPESMATTTVAHGFPVVTVEANAARMGNGALAHPLDGRLFRQKMQELFHKLSDEHRVKRVHLLPCASNAACVFLGQAYDNYHPEVVIYDFHDDGTRMIERLTIVNEQNRCVVSAC